MHKDISSCYTDLYKRIRRLTPLKLLTTGYITKRQLRLQYANVLLNEKLKFDYIKIKTSEGAEGVLHILYFGDFLPQEWLKNNWCEITNGCKSAYIKMCRTPVYNEKRLAGYCIDQYCINQNNNDGGTSFLRYSWSSGWAYCGFAKDWEFHKWLYKNDEKTVLYNTWNIWLEHCKKMSQPLLQTNLEVTDT